MLKYLNFSERLCKKLKEIKSLFLRAIKSYKTTINK